MQGKIFISYRRDDSIGTAGRLNDRLVQTFGRQNVFMDVDQIPAGVDFERHLNVQVTECDVFLAVIGPTWLNSKDGDGRRRLDNPEDFVRVEILAALARDIRVIPVLVDGAEMPRPNELPEVLKPLTRRNAVEVRNVQFGTDVERLIGKVREALSGGRSVRPMRWPIAAASAVALLLAGGIGLYQLDQHVWKWLPRGNGDPPKVNPTPGSVSKTADRNPDAPAKYVRVNNNKGTETVVAIYAQPSAMKVSPPITSKDWLPNRPIPPGKADAVHFEDGSGTCTYDLRATSHIKGREWVIFNFDVCKQSTWDLGYAACRAAGKATNDRKDRCVQIHNKLNESITAIYAVPSARKVPTSIAGKDWIPDDNIRPGKALAVNFDDGNGTCVYDFRATSGGADRLKLNVDVCTQSRWDVADRQITINNKSRDTMTAIYAVPSAEKMPGPITSKNWIAATLGPGQSRSVDFDDGKDTCVYDLRATSNNREWNKGSYNVCGSDSWNLGN